MSQTSGMNLRGFQDETGLSSIGTGILEVCECPESVTDRLNGLLRVEGDQNRA